MITVKSNDELVHILYKDHLLFRNTDPNQLSPCLRECVGWLVRENDEAIYILWERPVKPMPHERSTPEASGLVILKSEIVERKTLG